MQIVSYKKQIIKRLLDNLVEKCIENSHEKELHSNEMNDYDKK